MHATALAPFVRRRSLENTYAYGGGTVSILAGGEETGGAFAIFESVQQPGSEPPLHVHEREDEVFYILEGRVRVMVGAETHDLSGGDTIFLPKGVPHTFRIQTRMARAITLVTPAGFENWFRTIGTQATTLELPAAVHPPSDELLARMQELSKRLGVQLLDDPASR